MIGKLYMILGPMFSGKSSELIRRYRRTKLADKETILIKYSEDKRYSDKDEIVTHDGVTIKAVSCSELFEIKINETEIDTVCIDEIQFYSDSVEFCKMLMDMGIDVIVSGLNGSYLQKPIGRVLELIPLAHDIEFLRAVCYYCKSDDGGCYSLRETEDEHEFVIGGSELYHACCGLCYNENNMH